MTKKPIIKTLKKETNPLGKNPSEHKRIEKTLFKREGLLDSVFDSIQDGITVLDKDLTIVRVNQWMKKMYAGEMPLIGKKCYQGFQKRHTPCPWCPCLRTLEASAADIRIVPYPSEKNRIGWFEVAAYPLMNKDNNLLGVVEFVKDITQFKETEERLQESEKKYRTLFEESRDAIYITSREGKFIDANPATVELFGYTWEELISNLNIHELYLHSSHRDKFQEEIEQKGSVRNYEVLLCKKDGTEMDCLLTSTVRRADDGTILGYQGIIRDVTEFKRAEKALRESEARYRAIVEDQTELICRFLPNRKITFVNQAYCRYFGKKYEELIGQIFKPLMPEEDREQVEALFKSLSTENPMKTLEHRIMLPDNKIRWLQWTSRMVLDERGQVIEFQSVGRDITERKMIEEALKKSSEKIKLFAYSVSHDLKNPAIALYGLTKLLLKRYGDILDEKGRGFCDQILKTAEQISALAEKINVFVSTKESPLAIENVNLKEITRMVREEFSPHLNIRQVRWVEPEYLPKIRADRISLLRVLRNFVDNSLKYGGDDLRAIKIGYQESDTFHIISVEDDGVGLKKEASEKIFGFFKRSETAKGIEGTGLGLAIVKEIAEQHRGKVWMEPGQDKGITFFFALSKGL